MSSEQGRLKDKGNLAANGGRKASAKQRDVNVALRRAYESAVDEKIPQSMLDLLDKLG